MSGIDTADSLRANRQYVKRAMNAPLLESEVELDLARRWREQDDEKALHQLTQSYLRLVVSMAGRFRHYGLPMSDLIQEGNIGLMQAAARFEPSREVRFSTYASWWIRAAIQDYVLRNWSIVRTGTTAAQKSLFFNLRRMRALIGDSGQQRLSEEAVGQISEKLNVRKRDVAFMESRLAASDRSLNAQVGEDGDSVEWQDLLADDRSTPDQIVESKIDSDIQSRWIKDALSRLNKREMIIITERKLRDESVTLESLGKRLGISKERVRQIEHQALKKLKNAMLEIVPDTNTIRYSDET